ncbi:cytochrome P450 [Fomes fomentarius]|nr:cytochrome P450 [Fomes fomentarius]
MTVTLPELSWWWTVLGALLALFVHSQLRARALRLPPGPTPLPIIGNVLQIPSKDLGRGFAALSGMYGEVVHLSVLGQSIIVLGSYKAACDLMEKRSANYSGRPDSIMIPLVGLSCMFAFMNYGSEWRQHRRAFHQQMNSEVVGRYEPVQLDATRALLQRILSSPKDLAAHLRFAFAATVLQLSYGIEIGEYNDKYYKMVERLTEVGEEIAIPGRFFVEALPWLRYLPMWFPGAEFKSYAAAANRDILCIMDQLLEVAKAAMVSFTSCETLVSRLLDATSLDKQNKLDPYEVCKGVTATVYAAGADTTHAAMEAFFLAMTLFPEIQKKAQAELDAVVGQSRLPEFEDRHSLPYTSAVIKELLRWHVVAPIGLPHRIVSDDVFNGYLLPAGATVVANIWAISRDPETYPDPESFTPERFLDGEGKLDVEGKDPANYAFGFGRRICPGRHFAESSLFITCASILWAFDVSPPVNGDGHPLEIKHSENSGDVLISHTPLLEYTIKARSLQVKQLIDQA